MRHIRLFAACLGLWAGFLSAANISHRVYGTLIYADGSTPSTVSFSAFVTTRVEDKLNQISPGCGYSNGVWSVQCSGYTAQWAAGDTLHVDFTGSSGTGSIELILTGNTEDPAGKTTLVSSPGSVKLLLPSVTSLRGQNLEIPLSVENLSPVDSVLAFQITIAFDPNVLSATGASTSGTMTAAWTGVVAGPRESDMTVAGFTTNQDGKQLVEDSGNLVKMKFFANGLSGTQTTLRLTEAVIYTKNGTIHVAHTRCGVLAVNSGSSTVTKNLTIYPGWNLISLSVTPDSNTLPAVMNGVTINDVWCYIASNTSHPWRSWNLAIYQMLPSLNDLTTVDGLHGYWIKSTQLSSQAWSVSGINVPFDTAIQLYSGWNLIGYLPTSSMTVEAAFQNLGSDLRQIWAYRADDNSAPWKSWDRAIIEAGFPSYLNSLQSTTPLLGYWIKMRSAAALVYPFGSPKAMAMEAGESNQITDVTATSRIPRTCDYWAWQPTLFHEGDTIRAYDPQGVMCGDTVATAEGAFLLHVSGDDPETLGIDEGAVEGDTMQFTLNNAPMTVLGVSSETGADILTGTAAVFHNMTSRQIQLAIQTNGIEGVQKPETVEFLNYPNPFNGKTLIQYDMKTAGRIEMTIHDVSGRAVRKLIRSVEQSAGSHQVSWDGADDSGMRVSSGIYFARIRAGRTVRSIKLVVVN